MWIPGQRVEHAVYGKGTVVAVEDSVMRCLFSNLRHTSQENIGVKFDNGGPMGWGECGRHPRAQHHNIQELMILA